MRYLDKAMSICFIVLLIVVVCGIFCACNDTPDGFDMSIDLDSDIGLYFFGDDANDYVRYSLDLDEKYFDNQKDTIVYFHGWTTVAIEEDEIYNFGLSTCDPLVKKGYEKEDYVKAFKRAGYNVCAMDYSKHSSNLIKLAEYIWIGLDGEQSVALTFAKEIASFFKDYDKDIRFVGHSYGAQSSIATAYFLNKMNEAGLASDNCLPSRLTIADPYIGDITLIIDDTFLHSTMDYTNEAMNGRTPTEIVANAMEYLNINGVTMDMYCAMPGAYNQYLNNETERRALCQEKILSNCVWTVLKGCQDEYGQIGDIHVIAESWMFESFFTDVKMNGNEHMPTASLDTSLMRALVGKQFESTYRGVNLDEDVIVEVEVDIEEE